MQCFQRDSCNDGCIGLGFGHAFTRATSELIRGVICKLRLNEVHDYLVPTDAPNGVDTASTCRLYTLPNGHQVNSIEKAIRKPDWGPLMSTSLIGVASLRLAYVSYQTKSNLLVKYNDTVRHLKPCKIKIKGAWESSKVREQGKPCQVQESLESVKRGKSNYFNRELIQRDGKSHREGCFPPE